MAWTKGVTAHRPYTGGDWRPSTAWHAQFADFNNSGLLDLFVTKGNVAKMPDFAMKDPNDLLLQTPDGKFHEAGEEAGIATFGNARGAAVADFNLSGLLDIVVVNRNAPAQLWQNVSTNAGHWLEVRLQQPGPNRDAIGAWLEARCAGKVMRQEITIGGGHASGQIGWRHFGLGDATEADVRSLAGRRQQRLAAGGRRQSLRSGARQASGVMGGEVTRGATRRAAAGDAASAGSSARPSSVTAMR